MQERPSWISNQNDFSYFWSTSHPDTSYQVSSRLACLFKKKFKTDFQAGDFDSHIDFPVNTSLAIFDLQVTLMLSTKFRVNWPFSSGEEAQNRFPR